MSTVIAIWDIDAFPPTLNHSQRFTTVRGIPRRYDSVDLKDFKESATAQIIAQGIPYFTGNDRTDIPLELTMVLYWSGWLTKGRHIFPRRDVSNRFKALEDVVSKAIGLDDAQNWFTSQKKSLPEPGRDKYCKVVLKSLNMKVLTEVIDIHTI